jgi:hypothetical protein
MIRAAIVGLGWWGKTIVETVQGESEKDLLAAATPRSRALTEAFPRHKTIG